VVAASEPSTGKLANFHGCFTIHTPAFDAL
jgi:hypothetical protein